MTAMDQVNFRDLVRTVSAGRGKPMSVEAMDGLWLLVGDMAWDDFERGFVVAARETRFFPTPADIRAYAAKAKADAAVTPDVWALAVGDDLHCQACYDTGWREVQRDASRVYGPGVTVPAVVVCGCRASNPRYQAIRATTRRVGQSRHE